MSVFDLPAVECDNCSTFMHGVVGDTDDQLRARLAEVGGSRGQDDCDLCPQCDACDQCRDDNSPKR